MKDGQDGTGTITGSLRKAVVACALAAVTLGYGLLSVPPADGVLSRTAAPALLVLGYCVLIPVAILARSETSSQT